MLFKKVDTTVLDILVMYGCVAYLLFVTGNVAYEIGRKNGKVEMKQKMRSKHIYQNEVES